MGKRTAVTTSGRRMLRNCISILTLLAGLLLIGARAREPKPADPALGPDRAGGQGAEQADKAKERAIGQMRRIASAIKKCPEVIQFEEECAVHYIGAPANVEWDVLPNKTVRAPYQGILEFTLPQRSQDVDSAKQSARVHQRCIDMARAAATSGIKIKHGRYRYEFDLGTDAPELVKMLWIVDQTKETSVASSDARYCWSNAAHLIEAAQEPTN